jgi:uncharacterized protein (TIRG00374 family)
MSQAEKVARLVMLKNWRIGLLGLIVSLLAIYFIVSQVDVGLLVESLRTARYIYVVPTFVLLIAALFPRAQRWRVLLNGALPFNRAFSIMNVAYLVNGILPLRIGEVARVFLATRVEPPVPVFKTASTVLVERLLDLLAVVVMLGFALAAAPLPGEYRVTALVMLPVVIGGFLTLVILASQRQFAQRILTRLIIWFPPLQKFNMSAWLDHFLEGLQPLTQPRLLFQVLFWTALSWGISIAAGYIIMFAFFDQADWATTCLYIAAAALAIAVPAVPGNMGTYELSIVLALQAVNISATANTIVSFAVVVHWTNLLVHALTGVIGFMQEGISLSQLSKGVQEITH